MSNLPLIKDHFYFSKKIIEFATQQSFIVVGTCPSIPKINNI
jgi:hypothetical protein